ncbi:MAG: MCP four helix bundle domain-containing protein, partial [Nitrospirae bacterium]|nr:MCP four helix bundle domain-containing protein [Nitrospirota bacterium]
MNRFIFELTNHPKDFSVRLKLLFACGLLALMTGIVGSLAIWALSSSNYSFQAMVDQDVPSIIYLEQAERDMLEAQVPERSLMFMKMGTPESNAMIREHQENIRQVEEGWEKYKSLSTSENEKKLWNPFEVAWRDWKKSSNEVLKVLSEDTPSARRDAIDIAMGESAVKFVAARDLLDKVTEHQILEAKIQAQRGRTQASIFLAWVIG